MTSQYADITNMLDNLIKKDRLTDTELDEFETGLEILTICDSNNKFDHTKLRYYNQQLDKYRKQSLLDNELTKPDDLLLPKSNLDVLHDAHKQLIESETLAIDTINRLQEDKIKIGNIKSKLNDTQRSLNKSNNVLSRMMKWWRG
jgi:hypothetical protein